MKTQYPVIHLKKSDGRYDWYEVINDVEFENIIVPSGFKTDFASVPQILWWLIPPHCRAAMPSIIHDYTCQYAIFDRKKCDDIFRKLLKQAKVPRWQYELMYLFVRLFGWTRYAKQYQDGN